MLVLFLFTEALGYERLHVFHLGEVTRPSETCKTPLGLAGWMRLGL